MKQRNWIWVVIFAAIFAGCLALWLLPRGGGETVLVYQDGQLLRTLDLRQDTVFTVEGPAGENTVTVAGGEVFVSQADCPDQVCVLHGPLRRTGGPIVCLPNRLSIEWATRGGRGRAQRNGRAVMKLRKLTLTAVLTAAALVMFVLESQLPPLTAIPGIKPGLSNIFTLFAMQALGPGWALGVLLVRVTLGCVITGQGMALLYSLTGGLFAYAGMLALRRWFSGRRLWILSVFCAMAHNFGQLCAAALIARTRAVWYYLPVLTAGCNSGRCSDRALHAAGSAAAGQGRAAAGRQEARGGSKRMRLHIHGVHVPNRKNTAELAALRLPIPETVEIPMSMHIGAPAIPVVKPGDSVKVGQLIGKAGGFVSAPVYASVSGTVKKIGQQVGSGGRLMQTVVIAADGKQEPDPESSSPRSSRRCRTFSTPSAPAAWSASAARASRRS